MYIYIYICTDIYEYVYIYIYYMNIYIYIYGLIKRHFLFKSVRRILNITETVFKNVFLSLINIPTFNKRGT